MATTKITDLSAYTDPVNTDVLPIVDVTSDVTKKVSIANVMKNASLGTAAAPGIAFDGDPNTGIYSPGADQVAVSTGGTQRLLIDSSGAVTIAGDLTVNGTTTNINTQNLVVEDKNVVLGDVATPTDVTADGGGITLKGTTDKTINWVDATDAWTSSERFSYPTGSAAAPTLTFTGDTNTGIYSPGADQVSVATGGTERLRIDSTGQIEAVSLGTAAAPTFTFTGDPDTGVYSPGANQVAISTGGSGRLFVDASGNVKVGSTDNSNAATQYITVGSVGVTDGGLQLWARTNGQSYVQFGDTTTSADQYRGYIQYQHVSDFLALGTASQERLRITSAGLVGVGTSSPSSALHVVTSGAGQIRYSDGTVTGAFGSHGLGDSVFVGSGAGLRFTTNGLGSSDTKMFIDTSGRVGIGTSSPSSLLHLSSSLPILSFTDSDDSSSSRIYQDNNLFIIDVDNANAKASSALVFNVDATERARIDSSGRLGIGTTSPGQTLAVAGNIGSTNRGSSFGFTLPDWRIYNSSTGNALVVDNYTTEAFRVDSSNRLLVGTSSARANMFNSTLSSAFQVEGTTHDTSSVSIVRNSNDSSTAAFVLGKSRSTTAGGSTLVANNDTIAYLTFQGADGSQLVECASIAAYIDGTPGADDMPGRLVFSVTSDGASSPTERMRISQNGQVQVSNALNPLLLLSTSTAGTTNYLLAGNNSVTTSVYIWTNGNIQNTNGSYTAISDAKLKENIVDAKSQWNDLKAIKIRNWNYKEETGYETHRQIGPIAQELEAVCPGLVFETPDRDEDGNETGEVTKGVNQSVLYMKAVKALQEAMERIETLEAKVAALESA